MRLETAGAKTWLLGAVALWALVLWALGLFGLGSRIERLPEDPSLLQPLPRAAANAGERLQFGDGFGDHALMVLGDRHGAGVQPASTLKNFLLPS